jgi:hypothetical protein
MAKRPSRPSLFASPGKPGKAMPPVEVSPSSVAGPPPARPPSRAGKRVLSIYIDPVAWKQLRQLALDTETSTQALGEEAINLLFAQRGLNRSA